MSETELAARRFAMASSDLELIETLRNLSNTYDLWATGTAAQRLEDLLALLAEEACDCEMTHHIDPSKHFPDRNTTTNARLCRYRQLVEPEKPMRTVLDEVEDTLAETAVYAGGVAYVRVRTEIARKLLRLARASADWYATINHGFVLSTKAREKFDTMKEALRDIDPRLIDDE